MKMMSSSSLEGRVRWEGAGERMEWCTRKGRWGREEPSAVEGFGETTSLHHRSKARQGEVGEGSECQADFGLCLRDSWFSHMKSFVLCGSPVGQADKWLD